MKIRLILGTFLFVGCVLFLMRPAGAIQELQGPNGERAFIWSPAEMERMDKALGALIEERDRLKARLRLLESQCV